MRTITKAPARGAARRRTSMSAGIFAAIAALAISVAGVDVASAAIAAPAATTTAATNVTSTSATLNGTVTAKGAPTTYHFQYGTSTAYGSITPNQTQAAVNGNNAHNASANVTGLSPNTTYHFRIVATNSVGTVNGSDLSFKTAPPGGTVGNAVTIRSRPGTVTYGNATTISGSVTGANNAGAKVTLESSPFPYTAPFKPTGLTATTTTTTTGGYSFSVRPGVNTHYRVTVKKPSLTSSQTAVRVRVRVSLGVSTLNPRSGQRVRFSGTVTPAHNGKVALIQRRTSTGAWRTVARATLVAALPVNGVATSKYSKRLRIFHTATYRVSVNPADGDHVTGTSRTRRLRTH
jgi:hypothetical protein